MLRQFEDLLRKKQQEHDLNTQMQIDVKKNNELTNHINHMDNDFDGDNQVENDCKIDKS